MNRLLTLALLVLALPAFGAEFSIRYEEFTWKEDGLDGRRLLKESGPRIGLHLQTGASPEQPLDWQARGQVYLGTVDYDGQTQLGEPLNSTTDYYGTRLDADLGPRFTIAPNLHATLFAGGGLHVWLRRLDATGGFSDSGYDELWSEAALHTGASLRWKLPDLTWTLRGGLRRPLWVRAAYDFTLPDGTTDIAVEPDGKTGWFAELAATRNGLILALFAEEQDYRRSNIETYGNLDVFQPASSSRLLGARIGLAF
jgi:hypothetical protein